jgi:hypothetical protein
MRAVANHFCERVRCSEPKSPHLLGVTAGLMRSGTAHDQPANKTMTTRPALIEIGIAPRLLTRKQAASYCGVSLTTFTAWVRRGIVPGPVHRTHRWDRKAIDAALDVLSCIDARLEGKALDQWKAKHRARHTEGDAPS